jgi:hypothetical protein
VVSCLYMDDIIIFGNSINLIKEVKDFLFSNFKIKGLGETDVIINIKSLRGGSCGVALVEFHYVTLVQIEGILENNFGESHFAQNYQFKAYFTIQL